jgi:phage baseplate assembly protein W
MAITRALSTEDGTLNATTLVVARNKAYKDIDLTFARKPGTNDVYKKTDAAAVKQSLRNLISTNKLEKPFDPDYGGDIRSMLFELADDLTSVDIENNIRTVAYMYEPRAEIVDIQSDVQPDNNSVSVSITFRVVSSAETITFTTVVSRLR